MFRPAPPPFGALARVVSRTSASAPLCEPRGARQASRQTGAKAVRDLVTTDRRGRPLVVRGVVLLLGLAILLICPPRTTHAQPEIYGRWSQVKAWTGSFTGTGTGTGQIGDDGKTRVTVRQSVNGAVTLHQIQPGACAWVGP